MTEKNWSKEELEAKIKAVESGIRKLGEKGEKKVIEASRKMIEGLKEKLKKL